MRLWFLYVRISFLSSLFSFFHRILLTILDINWVKYFCHTAHRTFRIVCTLLPCLVHTCHLFMAQYIFFYCCESSLKLVCSLFLSKSGILQYWSAGYRLLDKTDKMLRDFCYWIAQSTIIESISMHIYRAKSLILYLSYIRE